MSKKIEFKEACWQKFDCQETQCPMFKVDTPGCWLVRGTFCQGQLQKSYPLKYDRCSKCEIFQQYTALERGQIMMKKFKK